MFFAGMLVQTLQIDRLGKRWAARCLFLLVFAISVCSDIWPLGDPDLSKIYAWMEEYGTFSAVAASDVLVLPIITSGNVIFFFFSLAILFVFIFIAIFYSRLYAGEKKDQKLSRSAVEFIKRLPMLFTFCLLIIIPGTLLSSVIPVILFFIVPALLFSPILITLEKMNPIDAVINSYNYTKGIKFSIFWNLLTLYFLYQTVNWFFVIFLPSGSSAGIFLNGFSTAFFTLAFGRMTGIFYDRICIHPVVKTPGQMN